MPNLTALPALTQLRQTPLPVQPPARPHPAAAPPASGLPADRVQLSASPRSGIVPRDGILFLGMNPASSNELQTLRQVSRQVLELKSENGKSGNFDLNQASGRADLVSSLGLDASRSASLLKLLDQADAFGRDELAELARIWAGAEKGLPVPGRLVISGHCDGLKIWGEGGRGSLRLSEIGRLADLFPQAAAQVEDLHLSGCNTGYRSNAQFWREHFPNLHTFWGYTHTAPSSVYASPAHLKAWESATRGEISSLNRTQLLGELKGAARSGNLALWSQQRDYQSALPAKGISIDELRQIIARFRLGEARSSDPQSGPLKEAYDQLQSLRGEEGGQSYDDLIGQALRLRFYDNLALNFAQAYGDILNTAFAELKLPAADFARLDRHDALQAATAFNDAFSTQRSSLNPEQISQLEKVKTLLYHFENMSPDFFAAEWIDPLSPASLAQAREDFAKLQPLPQLFPGLGFPGLTWPGLFPGNDLGNGLGQNPGNLFGQPPGLDFGLGQHGFHPLPTTRPTPTNGFLPQLELNLPAQGMLQPNRN